MNLKTIVLLVLVGLGVWFGYKWYQDQQYQKEQEIPNSERPTLLVFCTDGCVPCQKFKKDAVDHFALKYALGHYNVVEVDKTGKSRWNFVVTEYPTFIVLGKDKLTAVKKKSGYSDPSELAKWLNENYKN